VAEEMTQQLVASKQRDGLGDGRGRTRYNILSKGDLTSSH
jgi:hypothetical protein